MKTLKTKLLAALLVVALCLGLLGCQAKEPEATSADAATSPPEEVQEPRGTPASETENLVKLCKVWGYTKYKHPAFLLGKKDWDEELLNLIPQVRELGTAEEVNELLHNWFVGLGEIDYETRTPVVTWATAEDQQKVIVADTAWTSNIAYLGEDLVADFAKFPEAMPNVDRSKAPIQGFHDHGRERYFGNEPEHPADFGNASFRLLGLFRLWNAFEYYFPYLHLMDRDWEELLTEQIPVMLDGTDSASYQMSLMALAYETHDAHVSISSDMLESSFGSYFIPVYCAVAEGSLVVTHTPDDSPFQAGDVLLAINGRTVEELTEEREPFMCYPREEMKLARLWQILILCKEQAAEATVLRGGEEQVLSCQCLTYDGFLEYLEEMDTIPYALLENEVGYINIAYIDGEQILEAIELFRDSQGLVIDLREYPKNDHEASSRLAAYVLGKYTPALIAAKPSVAVPGTYIKGPMQSYQMLYDFKEHYEGPIVLLINDGTMSSGETHTATLSQAENAILMGSNTVGANGDIVYLPLPGGVRIIFSSLGVYNLDGTQTQRTGIAPDIRVEPTIEGIAEGRDEVLEAAIEYIKTKGAQ